MNIQVIKRLTLTIAVGIGCISAMLAADPTATDYTFDQCRGSAMPYTVPKFAIDYPDSLKPVYISHVGRHGARYPATPKHTATIENALNLADSLHTITPAGRKLLRLTGEINAASKGRWGALDSLGIAEQWGLASRMYADFPELFRGRHIRAISSYAPRCVMSMYSFLHQITRLDNHVDIEAASGRQFSPLLRFFDDDADYTDFSKGDAWREAYDRQLAVVPIDRILKRVLGDSFPLDQIDRCEVIMAEYSSVAGTAAMSLASDPSEFFTRDEYNALWQCFNLRQYLLRSMSTLSAVPAEIASPLLREIISSADSAISAFSTGRGFSPVDLRFGHAETLMPLLSLMRLKGCYYLTNYFDTVGKHWRDFDIVPMAANIRLVFFVDKNDSFCVRCDLNEVPVPLMSGDSRIYVPWGEARAYLMRCIPIYYQ